MKLAILDDDKFKTFLIQQALGSYHELTTFSDPHQFLAHDLETTDCVIIDLMMPEMSGWEVKDLLHEKLFNGVILICSALFPDTKSAYNSFIEIGFTNDEFERRYYKLYKNRTRNILELDFTEGALTYDRQGRQGRALAFKASGGYL